MSRKDRYAVEQREPYGVRGDRPKRREGQGPARIALLTALALLLFAILPTSGTASGQPTSADLTLLQDAHVDSSQIDTNFGTSTTLDMKHGRSGPSPDCGVSACLHTFLEFDVSGIPDTAVVLDANLTVQTIDTGTGTFTSQVRTILASWSESTVTWNNSPSLGSTVLDEFISDVETGGIVSYNITASVQALIGTSTFGLAFLNDSAPNKFQEWGQDENPARTAATLSVVYEVPELDIIPVLIAISIVVVGFGFVFIVTKKNRTMDDLFTFLVLILFFAVGAGIAVVLFGG